MDAARRSEFEQDGLAVGPPNRAITTSIKKQFVLARYRGMETRQRDMVALFVKRYISRWKPDNGKTAWPPIYLARVRTIMFHITYHGSSDFWRSVAGHEFSLSGDFLGLG
jgi:hypothetical protein